MTTPSETNTIAEARARMETMRDMMEEFDPCPMAVAQAMLQMSLRETAAQFRRIADESPYRAVSVRSLTEYAATIERLNDDVAMIGEIMHSDYHENRS